MTTVDVCGDVTGAAGLLELHAALADCVFGRNGDVVLCLTTSAGLSPAAARLIARNELALRRRGRRLHVRGISLAVGGSGARSSAGEPATA